MGQFLLSYWWLLILTMIIFGIVTRSLIKISIFILVLIVIFVLFWEIFIASGYSQSTSCFTEGAKSSAESVQKAKAMAPSNERNRILCMDSKVNYENLISCFKISKQNNQLSFKLYSSSPIFQKTIDETVMEHNKMCPKYPISPPSF